MQLADLDVQFLGTGRRRFAQWDGAEAAWRSDQVVRLAVSRWSRLGD